MATTAAVVAIVGAGAAAYSSYESGRRQKSMAEDKARDDRAAAAAEAKRLEEQREEEARIHRKETALLLDKQRGAYAAAGIKVDTGAPLTVRQETKKERDLELKSILKGYGYQIGKTKATGEASATNALNAGSAAYTQGMFQGFSSLLGGASSAYTNYALTK